MSAETRIVRGALTWGALATLPAAGATTLLRGVDGGFAVVIAAVLVLGNAALAALISAAAGRISIAAAAMVSLPSFSVRMLSLLLVFGWLQGVPTVDHEAFAAAFAAGVAVVIGLEARAWARTPWLALVFGGIRTEGEETT